MKKLKGFYMMVLILFAFSVLFSPIAYSETNSDKTTYPDTELKLNYLEEGDDYLAVWIPPPPPEPGEEEDEGDDDQYDDGYYDDEDDEDDEGKYNNEEEEYDSGPANYPPYGPPNQPPNYPPRPEPKSRPEPIRLEKDPRTAMMYSFFIPGLGQFYAEEPGKGMLFLLSEGILIGLAAYNWSMSDYYQRKADLYYYFYDEFTNDYLTDEMAYHYSDVHYNRYKNWLYAEIAIHLLDIFDARKSAIQYNKRYKLSYNIIHDETKVGIKLGVEF